MLCTRPLRATRQLLSTTRATLPAGPVASLARTVAIPARPVARLGHEQLAHGGWRGFRWSSVASASGSRDSASASTSSSSLASTSSSTPTPTPTSASSSTPPEIETKTEAQEPETKTLLIVYHTLTQGTRQMAEAAAAAARRAAASHNDPPSSTTTTTTTSEPPSPRIKISLLRASDAGPADVLAADAYIFACPENLATMAGIMKDFFDRSYYPVLGRANGRAYALLICAGSDGAGAMRQIDRICTGWRLKKATEGIIVCTHAQTAERCLATKVIGDEDKRRCAEVGEAMAEGLALGVF